MFKKAISIILFAFIAYSCFSQIPNSGFENWTDMGGYENPDSWGTMNNTTAPFDAITATKGVPGSPGSAYLILKCQTIDTMVVNGLAVSGVLDSITQTPISGFPFSLRPQSFTGKRQHMVFGVSQGSISVLLTKWNAGSGTRDTVATAFENLVGMEMIWSNFSIDFVYQSAVNPDTCIIVLKPSGKTPAQNDYLMVDSLAFADSTTGVSENNASLLSVNTYPNPANNEIEFTCSQPFHEGDRMIVSDISGNMILERNINGNTCKINTSCFANGTYICKLVNSYNIGYSTYKFIIQH